MAFLQLRDVRKSYATPRGPHLVLQGIDLDVEEGELLPLWAIQAQARRP